MKTFLNLVWAFLCTLLFPTFVSDETLNFSNSYFSLLMFVFIFLLLRYVDKKDYGRRMYIYTHALGCLFSFMTACGYALDNVGTVQFRKLGISILLFSHIFGVLLCLFWEFLMELETRVKENTVQLPAPLARINRIISWLMIHPVCITLILLLCWTPCYIADFPGGYRYDATSEYNQIVEGFNGNFPMLHSVLITTILSTAYELTGSYNVGVAFYTIGQMILISVMYTHILYKINKQGANKILIGALMLYCGLFPVVQILVTQTVRDVLFSALLTYTMFLFYLMTAEKKVFMSSIFKPFLLGVVLVLTFLARNNNAGIVMLIVIVAISILVWFIYKRESLRGATIFLVTTIGSYMIFSMVLTAVCQPLTPADTGASLSIMSQSIARAYVTESEKWSDKEIEELQIYMNTEGLPYIAENADPTKSRLIINGNFGEFFVFWCKIGSKHLGCYIDAILANTQNMWFPASIVDGYQKTGVESYSSFDKCYYYIRNRIEQPAVHMNLLPRVLDFYTKIGLYISFEKIPVISMLFSIGFQFWIMLNCLFYLLYRKQRELYLPISIIVGYMIFSAFVPLVLLRYFAAIFLAMPIIILFTIQPSICRNN